MIWKYCEDCHINGHCENQDKGHECNVYAKRITDKAERLQKQLDIAISYLDVIYGLRGGECFNCVKFARRARNKIKELNND